MLRETPAASNQTAEKLLRVLEVLAQQQQPVKLMDLAREVKMNTSTCYRFLAALQNTGYVVQNQETGKYMLNLKLCGLAEMVKERTSVGNLLHCYVEEACKQFHESAHLVQEEGQKIVYIDNVTDSSQSLHIRQYIGKTAPMYCTGVGKLFLSEYTEDKLDKYIQDTELTQLTEHTLCTKEDITRALEFCRINGYSLDNEECEIGVRCVAVPIRNYTGKIVAGLSVSGPITRVTDEVIAQKISTLLEIAHRASTELGYSKSGVERK